MNPYNPQIRPTAITPFDATYLRKSALASGRASPCLAPVSRSALPYPTGQRVKPRHVPRFTLLYPFNRMDGWTAPPNLVARPIPPPNRSRIRRAWKISTPNYFPARSSRLVAPGRFRLAWAFAWSTRLAVEVIAPGQVSWQTSYRLVATLPLVALASPGRPGFPWSP